MRADFYEGRWNKDIVVIFLLVAKVALTCAQQQLIPFKYAVCILCR